LQNAYEVLLDPTKRQTYDDTLGLGKASGSGREGGRDKEDEKRCQEKEEREDFKRDWKEWHRKREQWRKAEQKSSESMKMYWKITALRDELQQKIEVRTGEMKTYLKIALHKELNVPMTDMAEKLRILQEVIARDDSWKQRESQERESENIWEQSDEQEQKEEQDREAESEGVSDMYFKIVEIRAEIGRQPWFGTQQTRMYLTEALRKADSEKLPTEELRILTEALEVGGQRWKEKERDPKQDREHEMRQGKERYL
jgi:curved DNA-binding protein CbpA